MLAPIFHPAMKRVASIRRELGLRTVFNILGPLTNPAGAKAQVMGVYDPLLCEKLAQVFQMLGTERALVVHGMGMDEITNTGETTVSELKDGMVKSYSLMPQDLGYPLARPEDIAGGAPEDNARKLVACDERRAVSGSRYHRHERRRGGLRLRPGFHAQRGSEDG